MQILNLSEFKVIFIKMVKKMIQQQKNLPRELILIKNTMKSLKQQNKTYAN